MEKEKKMVLDVEENPSTLFQWFIFSIQHILAMLVACITVPKITGLPIGATLIAAGIGTLIYIFFTKKKSPVFLSSSFAYIAPMLSALSLGAATNLAGQAVNDNYLAIIIGMAMVGIVYVIIAVVVHFTGTDWLNKLLPPVVIGPVIMVIGLGLAGSAVNNVMGGTAGISHYNSTTPLPWGYTAVSILVALVACFLTSITAHYGKKLLSLIPFVIGMVGAYIFALILTGFSYIKGLEFMRVIDFTVFTNADWSKVGTWFTTDFMFIRASNQGAQFNGSIFVSVLLLFVPVAIVTVCEHIGDHKNLGNIIGRDLLGKEPGLTRTLIGDGLATAVSGAVCGAANTTYGENVAVIGVSKIASVNVIVVASIISIFLGFFGPLTLFLESIPSCITGGVSLILYGFIASSGVKMLIKEKVDFNITKNIIVASVILVAGIGGLSFVFGGNKNGYSLTITSTAVAMILGILMNVILVSKKEFDPEPAYLLDDEEDSKEENPF